MQKIKACLIIVVIAAISSCTPRLTTPKRTKVISVDTELLYTVKTFNDDYAVYKTDYDKPDLVAATLLRDRMIKRIEFDIERNFMEYKRVLFLNRAGFNVAADFFEIGLGLATTVTTGAGAKTVLGAVLTAFKGDRLSFDQNYFREKTTETLILKMEADRTEVGNRINDKMSKLQADKYTFEEALVDLVDLFDAGTLQGALVSLAADTGKQAADQKAKKQEIDYFRTASAEQVATLTTLRASFSKLYSDWSKVQGNQTAAKPFVDKVKAALKELQVTIPSTATDAALLQLLNDQITKLTDATAVPSVDRDAYLKKLTDAFRKAGILEQ